MPITYPYTQYSGVWTTSQATDAIAAGTWAVVTPYTYYAVEKTATPTVYASKDGVSWVAKATLPTAAAGSYPYTEIAYANGILVVSDAKQKLYRSTNQGDTFTLVQNGPQPGTVFTYQMAVDTTGQYWLYGTDYGLVVYSTDYGVTWTEAGPTSVNIYPVVYCSVSNAFIFASYSGTKFYKSAQTTPGTSTLTGQGTLTNLQYLWWATYNPTTGTAYATSGTASTVKMYYSTNAGASWTGSSTYSGGSYPGQYPAVIRSTGLYIASDGASSDVIYSSNNGSSWSSATVAAGITVNRTTADSSKVIVAGSDGIYTSSNGSSWTKVLSNSNGFYAITYGG